MGTGPTIPYQLRPHKAIDRNLMIEILRKLNRYSEIDLVNYRYVGFGAAFLDDFKIMHLEFGMRNMDCLEANQHAFLRQKFNNPYRFVNLYPMSSTDYINSAYYKQNRNQIIWLDYTSPGEFAQQLQDIEFLGKKVSDLDILKFTFNAKTTSFCTSNKIPGCKPVVFPRLIEFLQKHAVYEQYLPDHITPENIKDDFSSVLRAMAVRAVNRGLSAVNSDLTFNHISSFTYADGQTMTTITGIISKKEKFKQILKESSLRKWEFYNEIPENEFLPADVIYVPSMTVRERVKIDKFIPVKNIESLSSKLNFLYGTDEKEHLKLLSGYCKYYKYLPYFSKVTY